MRCRRRRGPRCRREELAGLRAAVLAGGDGAVGVTGAALGIHGQGGIGKTVLAAALARDEQVRRCFPDGVFWVTVGEQGDLVAAQQGLLARLGAADPGVRSAGQGAGLLRQVLAERRCLLVVDDVWSAAAARGVPGGGPGRAGAVHHPGSGGAGRGGREVVELGVLPPAAARSCWPGWPGCAVLPARRTGSWRRPAGWRWRWRWWARRSARAGGAGRRRRRSWRRPGRRSWITRTPTHSRRCRSVSPRWTRLTRRPTGAWRSTPRTR